MNRPFKFVVIIIGLVCVLVALTTHFLFSDAVSQKRFAAIVPGMDATQVCKILGAPDRVRHNSPNSTAFYYGGFRRLHWCSMEIYFDTDDRVAEKLHDH